MLKTHRQAFFFDGRFMNVEGLFAFLIAAAAIGRRDCANVFALLAKAVASSFMRHSC